MPSPFPGMNPYLEGSGLWPDFHSRYIVALANDLGHRLRPDYFVRIEEHVYIRELPEDLWRPLGRPDVSIIPNRSEAATATLETVAAPAHGLLADSVDELRLPYLEIVERDAHAVVTVIELLSPSNKTGPDRQQYRSKRLKLLRSSVNLVEIDLLRGGERMFGKPLQPCEALIAVARASNSTHAGLWPIRLREALPKIPIPLKPSVAEPLADLQAIFHTVYDSAGYEYQIYRQPPDPPLNAADTAWAATIVASASTT